MAASRNRVTLVTAFEEWGLEVQRGILAALEETSVPMAEAAKSAEVRRRSQALADSIKPIPVVWTPGFMAGGIGASDYKAGWYEFGTLARRSRGKSARGRSDKAAGSSSGVKGLHYLRKGLYASRELVFGRIMLAMREARGL